MTKEEFNKVWENSSREQILHQYYCDYMDMRNKINKVIEHLEMNIEHGCDATICEQIDFLNTLTGSDKE